MGATHGATSNTRVPEPYPSRFYSIDGNIYKFSMSTKLTRMGEFHCGWHRAIMFEIERSNGYLVSSGTDRISISHRKTYSEAIQRCAAKKGVGSVQISKNGWVRLQYRDNTYPSIQNLITTVRHTNPHGPNQCWQVSRDVRSCMAMRDFK
eukprot:287395_1